MLIEKYATKQEVRDFISMFYSDFNASKISDIFLKICNARIDAWIVEHGLRPSNINDRFNLLWAAVISIALEILCNMGEVQWTTGDIAMQRLNKATYTFQRWQPMFFFATGSSDPFKGLLPHETYRMMAYSYVEAYCKDDFFKEYGTPYPIPKVVRDNTSRGYGWNLSKEYIDIDDTLSEYFLDKSDLDDLDYILYEYDDGFDDGES